MPYGWQTSRRSGSFPPVFANTRPRMARSGRRRESSRVGYRCSLPGTARAHRRAARPPRPTPRTTNRRRVRRRARRSTPSQSPARSSMVDDPEVRLCRPGGSHERDASDRSDLKRRGRRRDRGGLSTSRTRCLSNLRRLNLRSRLWRFSKPSFTSRSEGLVDLPKCLRSVL